MLNDDKMGVYQILNIKNRYRYIGATGRTLKLIWCVTRSHLRAGTHKNEYLQEAYNKYGEECFKFEILEVIKMRESCVVAKQKWLDKLNPEYNIVRLVGKNVGQRHTEKAKQHMSNAQKNTCVEKRRNGEMMTTREAVENKKEYAKKYQPEYNTIHKEHITTRGKKYRETHKEERAIYDKKYYASNKEHILEYKKEYQKTYRAKKKLEKQQVMQCLMTK